MAKLINYANLFSRFRFSFPSGYNKWPAGICISILIALLALGLQKLSFMQGIEAKTLDARFVMISPPEDAASRIVLVGIDDSSLKYFSKNGVSWPWPRDFYAHFLNYMTRCGAKAVLFDLLFYEPDLDRAETDGRETDRAFANAIRSNGKAILATQLSHEKTAAQADPEQFLLDVDRNAGLTAESYQSIIGPIPVLHRAASRLGGINVEPDSDGVIRRVPLLYRLKDRYLPQLSLSGWLPGYGEDPRVHLTSTHLAVDDLRVPLDRQGNYLIHWYGRGSLCRFLECYPFAAVIHSASAAEAGTRPSLPADVFQDKFVILGVKAAGLMDLKTTPAARVHPGFEIWATVLLNLIRADFVTSSGWLFNTFHVWIVALVTFGLLVHFSGKTVHLSAVAIPVVIGLSAFYAWGSHRLAINITMPLTGFIFSYLTHISIGYVMEGRSKRILRRVMSRYLHPDLVRRISQSPERVALGGQEVEATVLFSDIYDFTTTSENLAPQELVAHLNAYFSDLTRFILDHAGMLDKYTGDGIMAVFGAPLSRPDHARMACRAALAHRQFSQNMKKQDGAPQVIPFHVGTRIGIHSGKIVAGNIGSRRRMDYTAIGDTVNLAARLESVNKIYRTKIIISEATFRQVGNEFVCRELDFLRVKGKTIPTRIYELLAYRTPGNAVSYPWVDSYQEALELYRQGQWEKAYTQFKRFSSGNIADPAALVMMERSQYLMKNPPENWDGIMTLKGK